MLHTFRRSSTPRTMIPLKKLVLVFLAAASLLTEGYCGVTNQEALAIYKDLVQKQQAGGIVGTGLEEGAVTAFKGAKGCAVQEKSLSDYVQVPSYIWSDYEIPVGVEKRDGKYKRELL